MSRNLLTRSLNHTEKLAGLRWRCNRVFESLESRTLLTTLTVDVGDAGCNAAGPVYCEIQEAEDVASSGDTIKIASGTYLPVVVDVGDITIKAKKNANPVIDATGKPNGVVVNADGVTVKGLEARNAVQAGFQVTGDNNKLLNNTAIENNIGFALFGSESNSLEGNTSIDNTVDGDEFQLCEDGQCIGILLESGSHKNLIKNNHVSGSFRGIRLSLDASDNRVLENHVLDSGNQGIVGFKNTDRNEIMYNHIENSARQGIELVGKALEIDSNHTAEENIIAHNFLLNNSHSDQVGDITLWSGAHRNVIRDNYILGSDDDIGYGIWLLNNNNENQIRDNVVVGTFNGLQVNRGANDNIIEGNEFRDSVQDSINVNADSFPFFQGGEFRNNVILENTITGSGRHGVYFANPFEMGDVTNNRLEGNLVSSSGSDGFLILNSGTDRVFANTFVDNTAQQNGGHGFVLEGGSRGNTFDGNEAVENGGHGFVVAAGSNHNTFEDNEAEENGGYGFLVDAILSNTFEDNECEDNFLGGSNQNGVCGDEDEDEDDDDDDEIVSLHG